jgi:UPF0755 protein
MIQTAPSRTARPGARHARPSRRRGFIVLLVVLLLMGGVAAAGVGYYNWCQGASGEQKPVTLVIPPATSASGIMTLLHEKGVIRCAGFVGKILLHEKGTPEFRSGTFTGLTTNMTLDDAIAVLTRPPHKARTIDITIPEGFRLTQIAARVHDVLPRIKASDFLRLAESGRYSLPPYLPKGTDTAEGFLFPETYRIAVKTATADSVIRLLLDQFRDEVKDLPWDNAKRLGVTPYDIVNIAAMIEKEAGSDRERPLIAAVIYNRLKDNMQLGIDATLLYDDPTPGDGTLEASDLESDSPYNTRKHVGLPPTPIASPQLASIEAALQPAHVDYLYYVLCPPDGPNRHRFSVSYDEFLNNKHACLGR